MAVRWAITNGNWSNTATWNDGGTLGVPTVGDDVWANGFTVNMDVDATVNSFRNTLRGRDIATPQMSSNTVPSPYVAASSVNADGTQPFQAFDRNYTATSNWWSGITPLPNWISMDFGSGSSTVIDGYTIYGNSDAGQNPNTWQFQGSDNNSAWTNLHGVTGSTIPASGTYSISSIGNSLPYRYYRFNFTANGGGTRLRIVEIELYNPGTVSLVSGGSFNFNTAGVTVSCTTIGQAVSNLFTITTTGGTVSLSVNNSIGSVGAQTTMTHSGSGDFVLTCPNLINFNASVGTQQIVSKTGSGLFTLNGNAVLFNTNVSGGSVTQYVINSSNGNVVINGRVVGNSFNNSGGATSAVRVTSGNLTINGDIIPDGSVTIAPTTRVAVIFSGTTFTLNGNTLGGNGVAIGSSSTVNINGDVNGGNSVYANADITINVVGDVYAGLFPAINCSAFTGSTVYLTGNMYNNLGRMAIWASRVFISDISTTFWRMDTGGGNYKFLYSADTFPNMASTSDVRFGTTFGPGGSLTGTMVPLSAGNTRKGVATDNTIGTAELTSSDIINGINASSDPLAVRLKNTLTDRAAGNIISQYKDS